MDLSPLLVLLCFSVVVARCHQLHFIKRPDLVSSTSSEYSSSIYAIPSLILKAFGLPNPDKIESDHKLVKSVTEKTAIDPLLAELSHNPLDPSSSQWLLIISGLNDDFQTDLKFTSASSLRQKQETVYRVNLHSPYSGIDLNQLLTVSMHSNLGQHRIHLSDIFVRSIMAMPNEQLLFHATNSKIFLSISTYDLPTAKICGRYYGGTMLSTIHKNLECKANWDYFGISESDTKILLETDAGSNFLMEFTQLAQVVQMKSADNPITMVMASTSLQALKKESPATYALAVDCLKHTILPQIIKLAETNYGLGSILLLGDILLGMASLEHRLGALLSDSISAQAHGAEDGSRPFCYSDREACLSDTNGCSLNGDCRAVPIRTNANADDTELCWQCVCRDGYAGSSCQFEDISVPFWITLVSILMLLIPVYFTCRLFATTTGSDEDDMTGFAIGSLPTKCHVPGGLGGSSKRLSSAFIETSSDECSESSILLDGTRTKHE